MLDQASQAMQRQQSDLVTTQQQLSSGQRLLSPGDDPVAAGNLLRSEAASTRNTQLQRNQDSARSQLQLTESTLGSIVDVYQSAREALVAAGNGSYSDADRATMAQQLQSLQQQLLGLANTADPTGGYLFSGFSQGVQPFAATAGGATYQGDQGSRLLQVSDSRQLKVGENGADLFERVRGGNGSFTVSAAVGNTGTGTMDAGTVTNAGALTGHAYHVVFNVAAAGTTYDVVDDTLGTTLSAGNAWANGQAIGFDGMQMTVSGNPASGDTFSVAPAGNQSVFTTLTSAASMLQASGSSAAARARQSTQLAGMIAGLDQAMDRIIAARSGVGSRLTELDSVSSASSATQAQIDKDISSARDLDYAEAASRFARQQQGLQAAQQSYAQVAKLSLFNYL
jgi:flagellar hook-associated protein 3 FlgL